MTSKTYSTNGEVTGETEVIVSRLTGALAVQSNDEELIKMTLSYFAMKLQRPDVAAKGGLYHGTALAVLQTAAERGYSRSDYEDACKRFLLTKQYGERIEPAEFFDNNEPEKLYPRSWYLAQKEKGVSDSEIDVYRLQGVSKAMYRRHDGKKLAVGDLVSFGGTFINPPKPQEPAVIYPIEKPDIFVESYRAKIEGLEFKLKQAQREIEKLKAVIERFKIKMEVVDD